MSDRRGAGLLGLFGGKRKSPQAMPQEGDEGARKGLFKGGRNMALKLPAHQFDATLRFYRDTLGLPVTVMEDGSPVVEFGPMRLWLDRSDSASNSELWLEITTESAKEAEIQLEKAEVVRCDQIEPLPSGFRGFWVMSPANTVHLVAEPGQDSSDETADVPGGES